MRRVIKARNDKKVKGGGAYWNGECEHAVGEQGEREGAALSD